MFYNKRKQKRNKRTEPIDCLTWRKIVLNKGEFEKRPGMKGCWVRANPDDWNTITIEVPELERRIYGAPISLCEGYRASPGQQRLSWRDITIPSKNHPLVEKGMAYWMNEMYIITGYSLKSNNKIYLPIFQAKKEYINFRLRDEIRKFAKFYAAQARKHLYETTLMDIEELKMLPQVVIMKIAHFTYDPFSYLDL